MVSHTCVWSDRVRRHRPLCVLCECASAGVCMQRLWGMVGGFGSCRGIRGSRQPPGCLFALISMYTTVEARVHTLQ